MAALALFKAWPLILERVNERRRDDATAKAGDWERIRAERNELRCLLRECERERSDLLRRAITAEATLLGMGDANQKAQRIVSTERQIDALAKKDGKK
jgi:hypothetical protein